MLIHTYILVPGNMEVYSRFSGDVMVAMLVYRTIVKKVFRDFDSIIMQNFSDILPLFYRPTWLSHRVSETKNSREGHA